LKSEEEDDITQPLDTPISFLLESSGVEILIDTKDVFYADFSEHLSALYATIHGQDIDQNVLCNRLTDFLDFAEWVSTVEGQYDRDGDEEMQPWEDLDEINTDSIVEIFEQALNNLDKIGLKLMARLLIIIEEIDDSLGTTKLNETINKFLSSNNDKQNYIKQLLEKRDEIDEANNNTNQNTGQDANSTNEEQPDQNQNINSQPPSTHTESEQISIECPSPQNHRHFSGDFLGD
jgi:hypothetical protein